MQLFNRIYTTAMLCAATAIILPAQTYTTLFNFGGTNGWSPAAALVQGTDGNLYGTTMFGGLNCAPVGCGTVFKITPDGTLTTLYSFCAFSQCTDGANPNAALVQIASGEFYGTTAGGGSYGHGTVFKMTPSGLLTTIYNFCPRPACGDGASPGTGLVLRSNGILYGTTTSRGANNGGTIFKITLDGRLMTLYSFCSLSGCADGQDPVGGLVQAANGDFYGTTLEGGSSTYCAAVNPFGCGTVFSITPSGAFTTLYSFCAESGCADGASPQAGLVQATNRRFYGTTASGGTGTLCYAGCGTVFQISSGGALTSLYSFTGGDDGAFPESGLIQATDGHLYGTTTGSFSPPPTIFKITPAGSLTTVSNISAPPDWAGVNYPALVQDTNGEFYGTTPFGTDLSFCLGGCGTIYSLSVGLGPFVKLQPASGAVGARIDILGSNLTGATAVSFNGAQAIFKVVSNTLIQAIVPSGATTGTIEVTTPGGTLVSAVTFRVRQ